jgi:hypothetical protein
MFFVLERIDRPGCFFPQGGDPDNDDNYVLELDQARVFKVELRGRQLSADLRLPSSDFWKVRAVELRLK